MNNWKYILCEIETKVSADGFKNILATPFIYGESLIEELTRTLQSSDTDDIYYMDVCDTEAEAQEFLENSTIEDLGDGEYKVKLHYIMTVTPDDNAMRDCEYVDDEGIEYVWLDDDYSPFDSDSLELLERLR